MKYDVMIIGAGVAGLSAAITCTMNGMRVWVAERKPKGYCKPCGDGLAGDSIPTLSVLGISQGNLERRGAWRIQRSVHDWGGEAVELNHAPDTFFTLRRRALLACLVDRAEALGAAIAYDVRRAPTFRQNRWELEETVAALLINANGCQTGLWESPIRRKELPIGGSFICRCKTGLNNRTAWFWHLSTDPVGYRWAFPLDAKRWNVGVWCYQQPWEIKSEMRAFLREWETEMTVDNQIIEPPHYAFLGTQCAIELSLADGPCFLAGDLAGSCQTINGEGISGALNSGINAAGLCLRSGR